MDGGCLPGISSHSGKVKGSLVIRGYFEEYVVDARVVQVILDLAQHRDTGVHHIAALRFADEKASIGIGGVVAIVDQDVAAL